MLRGRQPQITDELPGMGKAIEVADLRDQDDGGDVRDAPHRLKRMHDRCERPAWQEAHNLLLQPGEPILAIPNDSEALLDEDVMGGMVELEFPNPPDMRFGPLAFAGIDASMPKQESLELLS